MALSEQVYLHSPILIQHVLSSLYGLHLRHQRYGGRFKSRLAELLRTQWYDEQGLRDLQAGRLRELIAHATRHVPYYRELLGELGLRAEDIRKPSDLRKLPTIDKELLRSRHADFLAQGIPKRDLLAIYTSGTTGTPLRVVLSRDARRHNYAFFVRSKLWAGVELTERSATFGGRVLVPAEQTRPPYWRANFFFKNTQFSSFHISPETAPAYFEKLKALQPALIDSYPSSIYVLARVMKRKGLTDIQPKAIITSSETLFEHQRALIEEVFSCRIFDQYGGAEQVAFVCQCEQGSYHVNPEYGILELLDEMGQPVPPGVPGEVVATGFINPAMPLIRYRTGDLAVRSEKPCGCGRSFPTLERIEGRLDDLLLSRDGRHIGRLDPVFKGLGHVIRAAQIIQEDYERIKLLIEPDKGYQPADSSRVASELKRRLGPGLQVEVVCVKRIPRTRAGKFKAVVCRIRRDSAHAQ